MSETVLVIDHPVHPTEARRRLRRLLRSARREGHRWTARWTGQDRLEFETDWNGHRIRGAVQLQAGAVAVALDLPWTLPLLGGPLRQTIEETVLRALHAS